MSRGKLCRWTLVAIVMAVLCPADLWSQDAGAQRFRRLGVPEGLSQETTLALAQDSLGYVWVGTQSGLNRFDGYRFTVYRHDPADSTTIGANWIEAVAAGPDGVVWVGTANGLSRFDPRTERFRTYRHDAAVPGTLSSNRVTAVLPAADGIWVGTDQGLDRLDAATGRVERLRHDSTDARSLQPGQIAHLFRDRAGTLWVGGTTGLSRWDGAGRGFTRFEADNEGETAPPGPIITMLEDRAGRFWIGSMTGGLYEMDRGAGTFRRVRRGGQVIRDEIWALAEDDRGRLWLGSRRGLDLYDAGSGTFTASRADASDPRSLPDASVTRLLVDRDGTLWAGANAGGLALLPTASRAFGGYGPGPAPRGLPGNVVWGVGVAADGGVWAATDEGVARLDPTTATVTRHAFSGAAAHPLRDQILAVLPVPGDRVWIGSRAGLGFIDGAGVHRAFETELPALAGGVIPTMAHQADGTLWISVWGRGLVRLHPDRRGWQHYLHAEDDPHSLNHATVNKLYVDSTDTVWAGTMAGLARYDAGRDAFVRYPSEPSDPTTLSDGYVASIFRAADDVVWIGTGRGLNRLELHSGRITRMTGVEGLPDDFVNGILPDESGRLWLSTNNGVRRFDPATGAVRAWHLTDGLQSEESVVGAAVRSAGMLLFGGTTGITVVRPDALDDALPAPKVVLTGLRLFNEPVQIGTPLLPEALAFADGIRLSHREPVFTLEWTTLSHANSAQQRFAYRLDGFDTDWVRTGADHRRATYTNLNAGTYTFRVRAMDPDGAWGEEAALRVRIDPHPLASGWAIAFYALLIAGAATAWARAQRRKVERERAVNARLREVDRLKDEFLASTSHELRTPLHGIIGLTESLLDGAGGPLASKVNSDLLAVAGSARRLATLVNEILDFSRIREGKLDLHRSVFELQPVVDTVLTLLQPLANAKDIALRSEVPAGLPALHGDEARIEQMLHNLIGNAIKFTDQGEVVISAAATGDAVRITVADTGCGMTADELGYVFDAFRQGSRAGHGHGSGLGLAVTKQLVDLHGGSIDVDSAPGRGTTFAVTLPAAHETAPVARPRTRPPLAESTAFVEPVAVQSDEGRGARALVVDDDPINRMVLINHLHMLGYETIIAENGERALELIAGGEAIDVVLLDVMMPGLSGFEVCQQLRRSHPAHQLPVLFLTARAQAGDIETGLRAGANDYLVKPVSKAELRARLHTHMRLLDANRNLEHLVAERTAQLRVVTGMLPICGHCHSIRNDTGYWERIEQFFRVRSEVDFSHSVCPDCLRTEYGELGEEVARDLESS